MRGLITGQCSFVVLVKCVPLPVGYRGASVTGVVGKDKGLLHTCVGMVAPYVQTGFGGCNLRELLACSLVNTCYNT